MTKKQYIGNKTKCILPRMYKYRENTSNYQFSDLYVGITYYKLYNYTITKLYTPCICQVTLRIIVYINYFCTLLRKTCTHLLL